MGFFYFLLILAALAILCVVLILAQRASKNTEECDDILPREFGKNIGSPLFTDEDQRLALVLCKGDFVWALTPFGPQRLKVTIAKQGEAHLINAEFEVLAFLDLNYFSDSVARKLGRSTGVWRLERIMPRQSPAIPKNDPRHEAANRQWLRDEYYGDDEDDGLFDAMVFYYFLFEGFGQPDTYYEEYDPPVFEEAIIEPEVVEEPEMIIEEPDLEEVPAEVTEETFEEGIGNEPPTLGPENPEPIPEPMRPEPIPEPAPPAPEPEPYISPPPEPEPEPDRNWGGGGGDSYDSGSSYDSGDSGGSDDW